MFFSSISDRSKFPLMWVIKVPCRDTFNFLTLSGFPFNNKTELTRYFFLFKVEQPL